MTAKKLSDEEFVELWKSVNSINKMSEISGLDRRNVLRRRRNIELKHKIQLVGQNDRYAHMQTAHRHQGRYEAGILDGTVLIFSDAHFWPGIRTTAFKGLLWAIQELKPKAVINNGDAFDGSAISRFPRIGWDSKPSVIQELKACEACLGRLKKLPVRPGTTSN